MSRLVIVSNRVANPRERRGQAGGLAVALKEALHRRGGVWFGWSGRVVPKSPTRPKIHTDDNVTYATLDLSRRNYSTYYNGFANRALWPLLHYRIDLTAFSNQNAAGYQEVNQTFANKLMPLIKSEDMIWVHDYHLIPLGANLRAKGVTQPMGFFLHTPFPATEIITTLPDHRALIQSLFAYDLIGFQTTNDLRAFLDYTVLEAGGEVLGDHLVRAFGRTIRADIFPIGIDTDEFARLGMEAAMQGKMRRLVESNADLDWIIGVDRLDYSKGLVERFHAFEQFLEAHRDRHHKVALMQIAPPSRSDVQEYRQIRATLEGEAGHINGRFADFDWVPINYLNRSFTRPDLAGLYRGSRIGMVTPLRDGMNLVAKEYVAAQNPLDPGVLILSRFAGAARELDAALIVNPYDINAVAEAIEQGLSMSLEERRERWSAMMRRLQANTLDHWRDSFLDVLGQAPFGS